MKIWSELEELSSGFFLAGKLWLFENQNEKQKKARKQETGVFFVSALNAKAASSARSSLCCFILDSNESDASGVIKGK